MIKILSFCIMILFLFTSPTSFTQLSAEAFDCNARIIIDVKGKKLKTSLRFLFFKNVKKGLVTINGHVYNVENTSNPVYRQVYFNYISLQKTIKFESTKIKKLNGDNVTNEIINEYIPTFYTIPGELMDMEIIPQGKNGLIFSIGNTPLFLCQRS